MAKIDPAPSKIKLKSADEISEFAENLINTVREPLLALDKVSKEFSHIPIIAVTAYAFESDMRNSLAAGCESYLAKPFTKESLLNMIARYTRK